MKLKPYQQEAKDRALEKLQTHNGVGLLLGMGLGKTFITLSILNEINTPKWLCLVCCPPNVIPHWVNEASKATPDIKVIPLIGSPKDREEALEAATEAQLKGKVLVVISDHLLPWLVKSKFTSTCVIFDESSRYRNWSSQRMKAARKLDYYTGVILTGTPTPNHAGELFEQTYLIDRGKTYGRTRGPFANAYFKPHPYIEHKREFDEQYSDIVRDKSAHLMVRMAAEDHLDIPPVSYNNIEFDLPKAQLKRYKLLEKEFILSHDSQDDELLDNAPQKYHAMRRFTGGTNSSGEMLHSYKLDILKEVIEQIGEPVIVCYQYKSELTLFARTLIDNHSGVISGNSTSVNKQRILERWANGKIRTLFVQPKSCSHGTDGLQHGGRHIIWYTMTDTPDEYDQMNARLYRTGQTKKVFVHHLQARGTVDILSEQRIKTKANQQQQYFEQLRQTQHAI